MSGKLHGTPVLIKALPSLFFSCPQSFLCIKDNGAILPEFHIGATAWHSALASSLLQSNADIFNRVRHFLTPRSARMSTQTQLVAEGTIIVCKANLSRDHPYSFAV